MTTEKARSRIVGLTGSGSDVGVLTVTGGLVSATLAPEQQAGTSSTTTAFQIGLAKRGGRGEGSETQPAADDQDQDSAESAPGEACLRHRFRNRHYH
jgi:hypothetical protein